MPLHLIAACKTDPGLQREQNEDNCYTHVVSSDEHVAAILIVADGMGGYHAGEVASKIAVDTISQELQKLLAPPSDQPTVRLGKKSKRERAASDSQPATEDPPTPSDQGAVTQRLATSVVLDHYTDKLRDAVEKSSEQIVAYGRKHSDAKGLGSTVTAALVIGDQAFIANVGDSRTYLFRNDKLTRITIDHSLVERLVEAGQIDRDDVYDHPNRNLIYRSLGASRSEVEVDIFTERLQPGDALLLCCDGLWEMVRDEQMESILREVSDPVEACDLLVQRANENGGEDNITAVVARCVES
ncbi:MAG: Protein serine/threonine phosphatase PrpC, regulation of stationary phase [Ktedonobacterales bacterium]|jgi:protein phosphatase|nr:MAG: Protein serine/threonine phosphatase PrpC, regulation of stationary phase [Ktedonobacterales bacterium]